MRTKSLTEPTGVEKGHIWLSPDGHTHTWNRLWNGTAWQNYEEVPVEAFGLKSEEEVEEDEDLEEDEGKDENPPTEETTGERSNTAEVPDRDREQEPDKGSKQPAAGKQGKGGQGKRDK